MLASSSRVFGIVNFVSSLVHASDAQVEAWKCSKFVRQTYLINFKPAPQPFTFRHPRVLACLGKLKRGMSIQANTISASDKDIQRVELCGSFTDKACTAWIDSQSDLDYRHHALITTTFNSRFYHFTKPSILSSDIAT